MEEEDMTIRQQIESQEIFTNTEKSVTDYIYESPQNILDMSIHELAQITYTSTPTVLRVCRKLGYDGFKSFKKALLLEIENEKHLLTHINASYPFEKHETPNRVIGALSSLYKENIDTTVSFLNFSELSKIAKHIFSAKRFFIYAIGDSKITCKLFANKLLKLNIYAIFATENHQEIQETYNVGPDDYALFVTYKGLGKRFISCETVLKRYKVKTGLITSNADSPMVSMCTTTVLIPNEEKINNIATFYSQLSIDFVLNVLYALIYEMDYECYTKHKGVLDSVSRD